MTLYIVTDEPYHDNSTVIGVFETEEQAQSLIAEKISNDDFSDGFILERWDTNTQQSAVLAQYFSANSDCNQWGPEYERASKRKHGETLWLKRASVETLATQGLTVASEG